MSNISFQGQACRDLYAISYHYRKASNDNKLFSPEEDQKVAKQVRDNLLDTITIAEAKKPVRQKPEKEKSLLELGIDYAPGNKLKGIFSALEIAFQKVEKDRTINGLDKNDKVYLNNAFTLLNDDLGVFMDNTYPHPSMLKEEEGFSLVKMPDASTLQKYKPGKKAIAAALTTAMLTMGEAVNLPNFFPPNVNPARTERILQEKQVNSLANKFSDYGTVYISTIQNRLKDDSVTMEERAIGQATIDLLRTKNKAGRGANLGRQEFIDIIGKDNQPLENAAETVQKIQAKTAEFQQILREEYGTNELVNAERAVMMMLKENFEILDTEDTDIIEPSGIARAGKVLGEEEAAARIIQHLGLNPEYGSSDDAANPSEQTSTYGLIYSLNDSDRSEDGLGLSIGDVKVILNEQSHGRTIEEIAQSRDFFHETEYSNQGY